MPGAEPWGGLERTGWAGGWGLACPGCCVPVSERVDVGRPSLGQLRGVPTRLVSPDLQGQRPDLCVPLPQPRLPSSHRPQGPPLGIQTQRAGAPFLAGCECCGQQGEARVTLWHAWTQQSLNTCSGSLQPARILSRRPAGAGSREQPELRAPKQASSHLCGIPRGAGGTGPHVHAATLKAELRPNWIWAQPWSPPASERGSSPPRALHCHPHPHCMLPSPPQLLPIRVLEKEEEGPAVGLSAALMPSKGPQAPQGPLSPRQGQ